MSTRLILLSAALLAVSGCATQTPKISQVESSHSLEKQRQAQAAAVAERDQTKLSLKRKVALGRISNETNYGRSLLLDKHDDVLGKQVSDMLSKTLTESGNFLVFERPDIGRLKDEQKLTGEALQLVGVDTLIIGSLTEFGRNTTGETAFLSDSKKQKAFAKVDLRLVDSKTGLVYHTVSGAGEASTESSAIAGFGSKAGYDGTLNDRAINSAVSDAVDKLTSEIQRRSWQTDILSIEGNTLYVSGGKSQGIRPGMQFTVKTRGQQVKSGQTGFNITLPGKSVASVKVLSTFGNSEVEEGSIVAVEQGAIAGYAPADLVIVEKE